MPRYVWFEVVASGKMDDYKAWFEARNKRYQEWDIEFPLPKMYEVQHRINNMVCVVSPDLTPEEWAPVIERHQADEVIAELARERREKRILIDGTMETFWLT